MARVRTSSLLMRITLVLVVVLVVLAVVVVLNLTSGKKVTAYFSATPGLYVGDQVRVLGVAVGKIDAITAEPGQVKVEMHYDSDRPVPADAQAAIIAPTLISGRYVQLAPVYRGGPQLADGATIPISRTAVPVEWDDFKNQITQLSQALGPQANTQGALNNFLDVTSANLQGNGQTLQTTIRQLSRTATTLSDGRTDLFATIRNLQVVASTLKASDGQVDRFTAQLAQVSDLLNSDKTDLATALETFQRVGPLVQQFVADNRDALSGRVAELNQVASNLSNNRQEIANLLQKAPGAVANFSNIYDPKSGSITGAVGLTNFGNPAQFICAGIFGAAGNDGVTASKQCQTALQPLGGILAQNNIPLTVDLFNQGGTPTPSGGH